MGPPGVRGVEGPRGERGDRGYPGEQGPGGAKGAKGDTGREGRAGLDGNDGVPGEPGLDGVPGRNGVDGVPGTDGKPGLDGTHGKPGVACPVNLTRDGHVTELRCSTTQHDWSRSLQSGELQANVTWGGYPQNRSLNCKLYVVGKAVYMGSDAAPMASWMRDPMPVSEAAGDMFWSTSENNAQVLREYVNKTSFRARSHDREIHLPYPFTGNSHVVYNGKFFYATPNGTLVRLDLYNKAEHKEMALPKIGGRLYKGRYNLVDFNVDDNGLWLIYSLKDSNNTVVMKVDAFHTELSAQYAWNISINNNLVGEMFIVCGVLYVVDSVEENNSNIRFALDLYRNLVLKDVELAFTNPFSNTTMLGYSHRHKELYSYDKSNQLTYPVRYHEIYEDKAAKDEKGEPEASARVETGVDIDRR